jgi:hypothetical protein
MADTADREASKLRFLAMATDFEARAKIAEEATPSEPGEALTVSASKRTATGLKSDV